MSERVRRATGPIVQRFIYIFFAYLLWGFVHLATKVCVLFIMATDNDKATYVKTYSVYIYTHV